MAKSVWPRKAAINSQLRQLSAMLAKPAAGTRCSSLPIDWPGCAPDSKGCVVNNAQGSMMRLTSAVPGHSLLKGDDSVQHLTATDT